MVRVLPLFLMLLLPWTSWAEKISLNTKVSAKRVEMGDQFVLSLEVTSDSRMPKVTNNFTIPSIKGMEFINRTQGSSTSVSMSGGATRASYTTVLNFVFTPNRIGKVSFPSITIYVKGKAYKSKPVTIDVVKTKPRRKRPAFPKSPFGNGMDNIIDRFFGGFGRGPVQPAEFFVDVEVTNENPYAGEQFIAEWYIYTNGSLSQFDTLKFPTLRGFWKEDVEFAQSFRWQRVKKDGQVYRRALMSSYALTPYKAGTLSLDSFEIRATVMGGGGGFRISKPKVFRVNSEEIDINVQPLPEPKPDFFSKGVGSFEVGLQGFPTQAYVGEVFKFSIRVNGRESNAKFVEPFDLDLGDRFELYERTEEIKFFPHRASFVKWIHYLILPKEKGVQVIPDLKTVFFDPSTQEYYSAYVQFPKLMVDLKEGQKVEELLLKEDEKSSASRKDPVFLANRSAFGFFFPRSIYFYLAPALFILIGFFILLRIVLRKPKEVDFKLIIDHELKSIRSVIDGQDYQGSLERMIDFLSVILGALSGRKYGLEKDFDNSLARLPSSLKSRSDEFRSLNDKLQFLRFGSDFNLVKNREKLEECYKIYSETLKDLKNYL